MSASRTPTEAPSAASASARFTAVVLLPTPPLPEATAMMFLMPGTSFTPRCTAWETILEWTFTLACTTPGRLRQPLGDLRAHLLDDATGRIAESDVERHAVGLDLHVLHGLRLDVI